ncbi:piggyBac transposable element-derived protein 4-like [Trichonephila clavata]|uniref:PiggyBac transposable element-derived protein 4-like n=1 Tax=Trichonephila clavata TaxID=2740835 RepID=A0A8X6FJW9_TRICU|nr:piggyBac transposable element-derived protein 4-like [Trichonephila clavata]
MGINLFCEILRFLKLDLKSTRYRWLKADIFGMIFDVSNRFTENCISCFKPRENITIDEHLLPSKTRCPFTQLIPSNAEKYGQTFWLAADLKTKCLLNTFPYLGRSEELPSDQCLSEYVVIQMMYIHTTIF